MRNLKPYQIFNEELSDSTYDRASSKLFNQGYYKRANKLRLFSRINNLMEKYNDIYLEFKKEFENIISKLKTLNHGNKIDSTYLYWDDPRDSSKRMIILEINHIKQKHTSWTGVLLENLFLYLLIEKIDFPIQKYIAFSPIGRTHRYNSSRYKYLRDKTIMQKAAFNIRVNVEFEGFKNTLLYFKLNFDDDVSQGEIDNAIRDKLSVFTNINKYEVTSIKNTKPD